MRLVLALQCMVVRIDPLRFLVCRKVTKPLQALFVLSLLRIGTLFRLCYFLCYLCVLSLGCSCYRLSVPVQVIDLKDSSPK